MSYKILLVDDERHLLDSLALTLRRHDVDATDDPCEALDMIRDGDYAVVISDLRMPCMLGDDFLRAVAHESPTTVRLMLTGHGDLDVAMSLINSGGLFRFLTKPINADDLRQIVAEALDEHERLIKDEQLRKAALHDALTELPNRTLFMDRFMVARARADRNGSMVSVLFIDLDGFKAVNDTYGHDAGDAVLVGVAERLQERVRGNDTVARFGGDEFVVLLVELEEGQAADAVARDMVDKLVEPFVWEQHELRIGASIGIASYPHDGDTMEKVMAASDRAMYTAKRRGGGSVVRADYIA